MIAFNESRSITVKRYSISSENNSTAITSIPCGRVMRGRVYALVPMSSRIGGEKKTYSGRR